MHIPNPAPDFYVAGAMHIHVDQVMAEIEAIDRKIAQLEAERYRWLHLLEASLAGSAEAHA